LYFTVDFNKGRNNEEKHHQSSSVLASIIKNFELNGIWRTENPSLKQYFWMKHSEGMVHAARLVLYFR